MRVYLTAPYRKGLSIAFKKLRRKFVMDAPSQEVITNDDAMVQVDGVVFFQIIEASQAADEVNN